MTMMSAGPSASLGSAAALFHGFSDPSRLAILRRLAQGEQRGTDLVAHLGLAQSTVSQHLACLRGCGLVDSRPQGRASVWSLAHGAELDDLWVAAERLLAATGEAVALCPASAPATPVATPVSGQGSGQATGQVAG
ncbi:MAG: metalloregulator ArsR/SmtB family transcription factor [Nocardioides marinisabuli]|uniref:ArsR/SmtB family transcription factor n=1 Tax=Nocardioides marinisabuli TaxID=419476 RepID=UPI00321BB98F